jgi:hypothetical protein
VEEELEHVRRHFVDLYFKDTPQAATLGEHLNQIRAEKDAWVVRFNSTPDAQKEQVVAQGMNHFIGKFQAVNQFLEKTAGPWATVRVGDTVSYTAKAGTQFGTVTEVMYRVGADYGLKARPAYENPRGRRVPKDQLTQWWEIGRRSGAGEVVLPYSTYGSRWQKATGNMPLMPGSRENPLLLKWPKPAWNAYPTLYFGSRRPSTRQTVLKGLLGVDSTVRAYPPSGGSLGGVDIGIQPPYRLVSGSVVGPLTNQTTPGGRKLLAVLAPYGFDPAADGMQADHVHEIQLGGPDALANLWPLQQGINSAAGQKIAAARVRFKDGSGDVALKDLKRLAGTQFYFEIEI